MPIAHKVIGEHLRDLRLREGYTQSVVAEQLNISVKHYGHIERGTRPASLDMLGQISEYYGVSLEELIAGALVGISCSAETPKAKVEQINKMVRGCSDKTLALIAEVVESITRSAKG